MAEGKQPRVWEERVNALRANEQAVREARHAKGRLTARERVSALCDEGSFVELEALKKGAGVITGYGLVGGSPVYVAAQDVTQGGAGMNLSQAEKMLNLFALSEKTGAPLIIYPDSEGVDVREGAAALSAYARVFAGLSRMSGVCPVLSVLSGPAMGVAAHFAMLSDIVIAVDKGALMMPFSPLTVNAAAGTSLKDEELGGADVLMRQGCAALKAADEQQAAALLRAVLAMLPSSNQEGAPEFDVGDDLNRLVKASGEDGLQLALDVADRGTAVELWPALGLGSHTLLCQLGGRCVGLIAGEPRQDEGRLDAAACRKVARFVRFCDCFHLPVVSLVQSAGLTVPEKDRQGEWMRAASQMLYAFADACVPKVAVLAGSAVGAAYVAMGGKAMADIAFAWPDAMVSPLTREAAVQVFDADKLAEQSRTTLEEAYAMTCDGLAAAELGLADEVIAPEETRKHLIAALEMLLTKRDGRPEREHGNMPL